jgi:GNAT superfamily N-acetyltransferase
MQPAWRPMTSADLPQVEAIGEAVHPAYPEDPAVLVERLALYPRGCHVLADPQGLHGYAVSHPWHDLRPPPLNHLLGALPDLPGCAYIHDVALSGTIRGEGVGRRIIGCLIAAAGGLPVCLVAVGRSVPFWTRFGFAPAGDDVTDAMLNSYGASAVYMRRI